MVDRSCKAGIRGISMMILAPTQKAPTFSWGFSTATTYLDGDISMVGKTGA